MRRIAITNQKGGVGKTTTTVNLAAALGQRGQRVLLVDLDPQSHLTTHFGLDGNAGPGTYELLTESTAIAEMLLPSEQGLTIIPSRMDLAAAESELISVVGREAILRDRLAELNDRFDWLLIDCPPSFGVLTLNALSAVDEVLVPLQAHFLGLQGVGKLLETVNLVAQRINPALRVAGFVLCIYEGGTKLAKEVVEDLQHFLDDARGQTVAWRDARVFATRIRRNIKLAECPSYGKSIFAYAPDSHGAADYVALAEELLGTRGHCGLRIADCGLEETVQQADGEAGRVGPRIAVSEQLDQTQSLGVPPIGCEQPASAAAQAAAAAPGASDAKPRAPRRRQSRPATPSPQAQEVSSSPNPQSPAPVSITAGSSA